MRSDRFDMTFNEKFNSPRFSNGLQSRSGHQTPEARHIEKYIIKSLRMMILGDFCYVFFRQM